MTVAPSDTPLDTGALVETVERLIDVLDSEVDLLSAMKASQIGQFVPTKSMLIGTYERMAAELRADETAMGAMEPAERKALCDALERLTHSSRRNESALRAVMTANERLMRTIVDEVRRQQTDRSVYTVEGAVAAEGKAAPVSVRIDQQL